MKYFFVMNPSSGKKNGKGSLEDQIRRIGTEEGADFVIYKTREKGDAERFVREVCAQYAESGEPLRFFACGGDGTVNEIVNGSISAENAEFGIIPVGTGNDFARNAGSLAAYFDIPKQLHAESVPIDFILLENECQGETQIRYAVNMINIGFDAEVVGEAERLKGRIPLPGPLSYLAGVAAVWVRKKTIRLSVEWEGGGGSFRSFCGSLLLCTVGNGMFCGGGICALPLAVVNDGLLDVSIVGDISRGTFLRFFPAYRKGTHLQDGERRGIVSYRQTKEVVIRSMQDDPFFICADGEVGRSEKIRLRVLPGKGRFVLPLSEPLFHRFKEGLHVDRF